MKKIFLMAFLLTAMTAAAQKVEFSESAHDFGTVARGGGDVSHRFGFTNTGTEPVVFLRSLVSCNCVRVVFPREPVGAGVSGFVEVRYKVGRQPAGEFHKVVDVFTTATGQRRVSLVIKGESIE